MLQAATSGANLGRCDGFEGTACGALLIVAWLHASEYNCSVMLVQISAAYRR